MTALVIILGCIVFLFVAGTVRGNPGRAVADTALLVIVVGLIALGDLVLGQFFDLGETGPVLAIAFAAAFALDALYGLLAPDRQKRRDKKLRRLMKRRA